MSSQLVRYLFDACIESSQTLGLDEVFRNELIEKRSPPRSNPDRVRWPHHGMA